MKTVLHVINGLGDGGAEGVLFRLLKHTSKINHVVVSLSAADKYYDPITQLGIPVVCLNASGLGSLPRVVISLYRTIKKYQPDVVQTWLYHSDLLGGLTSKVVGVSNVVWGIRHTDLVPGVAKKQTIVVARLCAYFSSIIPNSIVCCAQKALDAHELMGYSKNRMVVIENGFDLSHFAFSETLNKATRSAYGLQPDDFVIGCVARFHPQKGHCVLLEALSILRHRYGIRFTCLLIGNGLDSSNTILCDRIDRLGLTQNIKLIGAVNDVASIYNALDLHVLPSISGEGFPNVVAESMSVGVPNVVTDVGDAKVIVGRYGWVVDAADPEELAEAIHNAVLTLSNETTRSMYSAGARMRIAENYSMDRMTNKFLEIWKVNI